MQVVFLVAAIAGLVDLSGQPADPIGGSNASPVVVVFTRTDCPISNRYAPELRRIWQSYAPQGVGFYLVYPDRQETADIIRKHVRDYNYPIPALRDVQHELVQAAQASVTPEAAIFVKGKLVYHGRIDDRYADPGKARPAPTVHDLERTLDAVLAGRTPPVASTPAVGCSLADLR